MRVVSEQSEEDKRRRRTSEAIAFPLRLMAANVLRTVAGAGRPEQLLGHMGRLAEVMNEYREAHGHFPPSHELRQLLDLEVVFAESRPWLAEREIRPDAIEDAENRIVKHSLRHAAATLLDQGMTTRSKSHPFTAANRTL